MAVFDINGNSLSSIFDVQGASLDNGYSIGGVVIYRRDTPAPIVDYSKYSFVEKWTKNISDTQGFDIYDGKVFWVSKSGNASIPANCYVWNLENGSQALSVPYITIYSGHGNNLCFDYPVLYADSAYTPHVYINRMASDFLSAALEKTLYMNDGNLNCDACIDENDKNIMWTLGHMSGSTSVPFKISKWNLANLTDNGDGTFTPELLQSVDTPQPASSFYFQGCKFHDGMLWYASGYAGSSTRAYVFAVDPNTGNVLYTIDCETTAEPEGLAFYPDTEAAGGYALYVGFARMVLRKYTFAAK